MRNPWAPVDSPFRARSHAPLLAAAMQRDFLSDFATGLPRFGLLPPPDLGSWGPSLNNQDHHWASEGYVSQTVNGVTQTVHKRRDWDVSRSLSLPMDLSLTSSTFMYPGH